MAQIARVVAPRIPHHITQRGNRRQQTFFFDEDYHQYLSLIGASYWQKHLGDPQNQNQIFRPHIHILRFRII